MFRELLQSLGADLHTTAILIFFVTFFAVMLGWVFRRPGAALYRDIAQLPFDHEET